MARSDSAGRLPSAPSRASTSEPRACMKFARDVVAGAAARSITRTDSPCKRRLQANVRPVGPAPTTMTSVSISAPVIPLP